MHALESLYRCLTLRCPGVHKKRITSLCATAMSAVSGSALSVSDLGRGIMGRVSAKHNIKRVDRLLGNRSLHAEIPLVYEALARQSLAGMDCPLIIVDWSVLTRDGTLHLLRASVALKGRAVTLYEQVHPVGKLGAPEVHAAFLSSLAAMLPARCVPVILTDAGFHSTWFDLVNRMGWTWIGRIRGRDMVKPLDGQSWEGCKTLYQRANTRPRSLGTYHYVRSHPVTCRLVLVKLGGKGRHRRRHDGQRAQSRHSCKHSRAQTEPWLLAVCPRLAALDAPTIVAFYAQRMQIEEAFRDLKSERFGLGMASSGSKKPERLGVLLLIGALAAFVLRLTGEQARILQLDRQCQSNTRRSRPVLSVISLAKQLVRKMLSASADEELATMFQHFGNNHVAPI